MGGGREGADDVDDMGRLGDGGAKPELVAALGHGVAEPISVGEEVGVLGEPVVSASLLCGHGGVAGLGLLQPTAVLPPGAGEAAGTAVPRASLTLLLLDIQRHGADS